MPAVTWQLASPAAVRYEASLVPALMAQWALKLLERTGLSPGNRLLDVACGTGIVARTAAERFGALGRVSGIDINPEMLAVARSIAPELEWHEGDAASLPFADASFDRVTCQFALMFFPHRDRALSEMRRVLSLGGRLGVATCGPIEAAVPYARLAEIVRHAAGEEATAIMQSPFSLSDPEAVAALLKAAGFTNVTAARLLGTVDYPTIDAFLEGEIDATPLGSHLHQLGNAVYARVRDETCTMLTPFQRSVRLQFPFEAVIATGERA